MGFIGTWEFALFLNNAMLLCLVFDFYTAKWWSHPSPPSRNWKYDSFKPLPWSPRSLLLALILMSHNSTFYLLLRSIPRQLTSLLDLGLHWTDASPLSQPSQIDSMLAQFPWSGSLQCTLESHASLGNPAACSLSIALCLAWVFQIGSNTSACSSISAASSKHWASINLCDLCCPRYQQLVQQLNESCSSLLLPTYRNLNFTDDHTSLSFCEKPSEHQATCQKGYFLFSCHRQEADISHASNNYRPHQSHFHTD